MPQSGVFYSTEALPGLIQPLAPLLPTTHAFAAGRTAVDGGGVAWGQLGIGAASALAAAAVALVFLRRMLATFRARGYINRYL